MEKNLKYLHWVGWTGLRMCSSGQAWKSTRGRRLHWGGSCIHSNGCQGAGCTGFVGCPPGIHLYPLFPNSTQNLMLQAPLLCPARVISIWGRASGRGHDQLKPLSLELIIVFSSFGHSHWFRGGHVTWAGAVKVIFRTVAGKAGTAHSLSPWTGRVEIWRWTSNGNFATEKKANLVMSQPRE